MSIRGMSACWYMFRLLVIRWKFECMDLWFLRHDLRQALSSIRNCSIMAAPMFQRMGAAWVRMGLMSS